MDTTGLAASRAERGALRRVVILLARRAAGELVGEERMAQALAELIESGERARAQPWSERQWRSAQVQALLAWALGERR